MKNIKYLILSFGLLSLGSCNLDQEFYSDVAEKDYITSDSDVNTLVIGCYNALYGTIDGEWALTEIRSDNTRSYNSGSSTGDNLYIANLDQAVINSSNDFVTEYWEASYVGIYRSNKVIAFLDVVKNATLRKQYEGEARFLRALHYFNLIRLWGPVFLVTEATNPDDARDQQRATSEQIYSLIESDLTKIIDGALLPDAMDADNAGRATMTAAKALLAKVYMTNYAVGDDKYNVKAKALLEEVIAAVGQPASSADLVPYADIFDYNNEMNDEIIFAIRHQSGNVGIGSPFGNYFSPLNNGGNVLGYVCYNRNRPSDELITLYKDQGDDIRRNVAVQEGYFVAATGVYNDSVFTPKYNTPVTAQNDGDTDWPVIRVGDILLLYAELVNEISGANNTSLTYLNMIRERAGITPYTLADLPSLYQMREAIRTERRMELSIENQRWFDLLRWGTAAEVVSEHLKGEVFYGDFDPAINATIENWQTILPIPIDILNINPDVAQNFGY